MQESSCIVGVGNGKSVLTLFRLPEGLENIPLELGVRPTSRQVAMVLQETELNLMYFPQTA